MKKNCLFYAGVLVILAACQKETLPKEAVPAGPVILSATIEDNTKANVMEETGVFSFEPENQIAIRNGNNTLLGTTAQGGTKADFTMDERFNPSLKGFAVYPPSAATYISEDYVTFRFPGSYEFSEVGGVNADSAPVPCLMMAYYNGDGVLNFRHVGALVRFKIFNTSNSSVLPKDMIFTFTTPVSGNMDLTAVPTTADGGVVGSGLEDACYSIVVHNVPITDPSEGEYVYITLPVPVGTDPHHVSIFQRLEYRRRSTLIYKEAAPLKRAQGYKVGASIELDPLSNFGGCQIAGFLHFGENPHHSGDPDYEVFPYYFWYNLPKDHGRNAHYFEYDNIRGTNEAYNSVNPHTALCSGEGVNIRRGDFGNIKVRIPTGNGDEWYKILGVNGDVELKRPGATVNGHKGVHYAYVTVRNYNGEGNHCYGLLLFPDHAVITTSFDDRKINISEFDKLSPVSISGTVGNYVSHSEMNIMTDQGCFFMPTGYADAYDEHGEYQNDGYYVKAPLSEGRYWTATNTHEAYDHQQHLFYVRFSDTLLPTDNESVFQSVGDNYFNVVVIKAD